jgi:hypothetical protein
MSQSIKQRTGALSIGPDAEELRLLLEAAQTDLAALKTTTNAIITAAATNLAAVAAVTPVATQSLAA